MTSKEEEHIQTPKELLLALKAEMVSRSIHLIYERSKTHLLITDVVYNIMLQCNYNLCKIV